MAIVSKRSDLLTIGEVLNQVRSEFDDISISKIRFLEAEGLIVPSRTKSGYRKFSSADVDKLRYILRMQRDHYLPLKVIKEHIEAIDRGLKPEIDEIEKPKVPSVLVDLNQLGIKKSNIRVTREELIANTSITDQDLKESEDYGLIKVLADKRHYDDIAVKTARVIAALSGFGLEPRHLKFLKSGSDRESSLIKQVASPMSRSKRPDAGEQALEMMREISNLTNQLHFILVSSTLDEEIL
ncbi:MerR family transcriptional regulator [Actinomycetes bacterium]|nr:MerR family transcriptional regulator [Actinomycetes bacterium]